MSIVMSCPFCGEIDACYPHKDEDGQQNYICVACEVEHCCGRCGVIVDDYERDEWGYLICCECAEKEWGAA